MLYKLVEAITNILKMTAIGYVELLEQLPNFDFDFFPEVSG